MCDWVSPQVQNEAACYIGDFEGSVTGSVCSFVTLASANSSFVDVDGNGTIEPDEIEDLIGLNGVVETRVFGATIRANANGIIRGEYWDGPTNAAGQNRAWRGRG